MKTLFGSVFVILMFFFTTVGLGQAPIVLGPEFISHNGLLVKWTGIPNVTKYRVDISSDDFNSFVPGFENYLANLSSATTGIVKWNFIGFQPETTYQLRVRAETASGITQNSNTITFTTVETPPSSSALLWQNGFGNEGFENITSMTIATDGFLYVIGAYEGTMDFGGIVKSSQGNRDGYLAKYNLDGDLQSINTINGLGNEEIWGITSDATSLYLYGIFDESINMDFQGGSALLDPRGIANSTELDNGDGFIASYALSDLSLNWAKSLGDAFPITGNPIQSDGANIYITGTFLGSNDFDPGLGTNTLTGSGDGDVFLASYKIADGSINWAVGFGGTNFDWGYSILINNEFLYTAGFYTEGTDLDPGSGVVPAIGYGGYFSKFNKTDGSLIWARSISGTPDSYATVLDLAIDANSIFLAGDYGGLVDFDPGVGEALKASNGKSDSFFAKYTLEEGEFIWVQTLKGSGSTSDDLSIRKIVVDNASVYLAGNSQWSADYDPGLGEANRTAFDMDVFLASYQKTDGSFNWAKTIGGSQFDLIRGGLAIEASGIYVGAQFTGFVNFDPYSGFNYRNSTGNYVAVAKYKLEDTPPGQPTANPVENIVATSVKATWTVATDATSYRLDVSADDFTSFVPGYQDRAISAQRYLIQNLSEGTQYKYRVRAVNAFSISSNSNEISFKTKLYQTISFPEIVDKNITEGSFILEGTASSNLKISFTNLSSTKLEIVENKVNMLSPGKASILALQEGNDEYVAAESVERTFCVLPEKPKISVDEFGADISLVSSSQSGNQWFLDGIQIDGVDGNVISPPSEDGSYTVKTVVEGCESEMSDAIQLVVTGIEDGVSNFVRMGPNPTSDFVYVSKDIQNVTIWNLQGKELKLGSDSQKELHKIDLSNYPPGVYLIMFQIKGKINQVRIIRK